MRWLITVGMLGCCGVGQAAEEQALVSVWQLHRAVSNEHARVISACDAFAAKHADDSFVPVVRCIQGWRLLAAGNTNQAVRVFSSLVDQQGTDVARAADEMARAWLTRVDREAVIPALKAYYKAEVKYPPRFNALVDHPRIAGKVTYPLTDRWSRPWKYSAVGYKGLPGFVGQRFELTSNRLGEFSALEKALAVPYGSRLDLSASPVSSAGRSLMRMRFGALDGAPEETVVVEEGQARGDIVVVYVSPKLVLVRDLLHWKLLPVTRDR